MDKKESIVPQASATAAVSAGVSASEDVNICGVYHVDCQGPLEHQRADYIKARDKMLRVEAKIDTLKRRLPWVWRVAAKAAGLLAALSVSTAALAGFTLENKWADTAPAHNLVTTIGKNLLLDTILAGSAYTTTGPYLGLIGNVSYTTGPAVGDTMASHGGWTESGGTNAPTYSGTRKTLAFSSATGGSKATSSAASFGITSGTNVIIKGCFLVLGTGALSTIDNTAGTLYSAGTFTGGDKTVSNGDTLSVSYTATA